MKLITAAAIVVLGCALQALAVEPDEAAAPSQIKLDSCVLEFQPTRPDLTVGIVWFTMLTPDNDWALIFDPSQKDNYKDQGTLKVLDLKEVGKNRFEFPDLTLERHGDKNGAVCMSIKIWFKELPNERVFYFEKIEDRYSQLSYCSRDVPEAQHHFSQNRVATLEEFKDSLKKPLVLRLTQNGTPWRPGIYVDGAGVVYFHSLLVGRFPEAGSSVAWGVPGPLSSHREQIWKLDADGSLKQLSVPSLVPVARTARARQWADRVRSLATDHYGTLISIAIVEPVACDSSGNLYAELITPDTKDSAELYQLAKIDADGVAHAIAGSTRGHKDGSAKDAQFWRITAMTCSPKGDVYVADGTPATGSWIRCIHTDGTVTTVAGCDKVGLADGKKDAAQFYCPSGLAVDSVGNILIADPINARIRKVTPDGTVTTLLGSAADGAVQTDHAHDTFIQPSGIAIDPLGNLYVLDGGQKMARIRKVSPDGKHVETLVVVDAKAASGATAPN